MLNESDVTTCFCYQSVACYPESVEYESSSGDNVGISCLFLGNH